MKRNHEYYLLTEFTDRETEKQKLCMAKDKEINLSKYFLIYMKIEKGLFTITHIGRALVAFEDLLFKFRGLIFLHDKNLYINYKCHI